MPVCDATCSFAGDTTGQPVFNRPTGLGVLSNSGTAVHFQTFTFAVSTADDYNVVIVPNQQSHDSVLVLYTASFDPLTPLVNEIAFNDDVIGGVGPLSHGR